jgi:hypothetical protein
MVNNTPSLHFTALTDLWFVKLWKQKEQEVAHTRCVVFSIQ